MFRPVISRLFSTTSKRLAEVEVKVSKEALVALRKRTGYSYVNCRKALVKFGENDMDNAEKWLKEAAAKEGWAKAAKLGSRATANGLVSLSTNNSIAAIVELSCETDFVARADHFKNLLSKLNHTVLSQAEKDFSSTSTGSSFQELSYELENLNDAESGKNLREVMSLSIGKLGENMVVKRLKALKAPEGTLLFGSSHPKDENEQVLLGRFVSLIALKQEKPGGISSQQLAGQICQHIIGMAPEKLGTPPTAQSSAGETLQAGHDPEAEPVRVTQIDESENALLKQSFMLNPSQTVHDYLTTHNAKVIDFVRVELGSE
ncbi:unnamed protein product [Caenorhabditis angaria]|uniref:Elongation factor Ts, mitochondrial n=1 Tax=Caenorhabditis angaria TaxID=860376 RepID=A0A9P1IVP8_9PELO|nr:unnamed protein product [Caenorhabditis angaria]